MIRTLGIIDCASSSLDNSAQLSSIHSRRFAGQSLLQWITRRCSDSQLLDRIVVLTDDANRVKPFVPCDIPIFVSQRADPLARFADVVTEFTPQSIVRIRLDQPFTDPDLIDGLIATAKSKPHCDYISYCTNDGKPTVQSRIGVFAEWCRSQALEDAHRAALAKRDRDEATRYIYTHPEQFTVSFIPAPESLDRPDLRLCIHDEEDWDHAESIVDALGSEELAWQSVADLLQQQPALRERMATLNRAEQATPST